MPAPTEQRSSAPDRIRTVCCVCKELIQDGATPHGLVSHGVHPGECARRLRDGEAA
jgi:hypothetical protein